eukprot:3489741-Pyramimonas_sp.AAC.1
MSSSWQTAKSPSPALLPGTASSLVSTPTAPKAHQVFRELQGVTGSYSELQGVTRSYRELQGVREFPGTPLVRAGVDGNKYSRCARSDWRSRADIPDAL